MDGNIVALVVITVVNIAGWGISWGKMKQKVDSIDDILNDGLVKKVDDINTTIASLESRVNTYIELKERD